MGLIHNTISGKECQSWSSNSPHVIDSEYTDDRFPDGSRAAAHNYCRNPDENWNEGVWCYTTDPNTTWGACPVTKCGKFAIDIVCYPTLTR